MRLLENREVRFLQPVIGVAIEQAKMSPCQKSQRGAVVFKDALILGRGFNTPILGRQCHPEICRSVCTLYTIHAERNAYQDAIASTRSLSELSGASILHIKLENGIEQWSDDLSCIDCSRYLIRTNLKEFLLFTSMGWVGYPIREFHELTDEYARSKEL